MSAYGYVVVIKRDGDDGTRYPITKQSGFTVGSGVNCDIRLLTEAVDHSHCQIIPSDVSRPILKHVGSYGKTLLNGTDIGSAEISLHHGDIIGVKEKSFRWDYTPNSRFYIDYKSYKSASTPVVSSPTQKTFRRGLKSPITTVVSPSPGTPQRPIAFVSPHMRTAKQEPEDPEIIVLSHKKAEPQQSTVNTPKPPINSSGKKFVAVHHTCSAENHSAGSTPKNTPGRGKVAIIASPQLSVQQPRPAVKNTPVRIVKTFTGGSTSKVNVRMSPVLVSASGRKLPIVLTRTPQNIPLGSRSTIRKSKLRPPSILVNYSLVSEPGAFELRRQTSSETKMRDLNKSLSPSRTSNVTLRKSVPVKIVKLRKSIRSTGQKLQTPLSHKKTDPSTGTKSVLKTPLPKTTTTKRKLEMGMSTDEKAEKAARDLKERLPKTPDRKKMASLLKCYNKSKSPMKINVVQSHLMKTNVVQSQSGKPCRGVMHLPVISSSTGKKLGMSKIPVVIKKVSISATKVPRKSPAAEPLSTAIHKVEVKTLVSPETVKIVNAADISPRMRASDIKRNLSDSFSEDVSEDATSSANSVSPKKRMFSARKSLVASSGEDVLTSPEVSGSVENSAPKGVKRRTSTLIIASPGIIENVTPVEKKIRLSGRTSDINIPEHLPSPPKSVGKFKTPTSILKSSHRGSIASSAVKTIKFDTPIENFFNDVAGKSSSRKSVSRKSFPTQASGNQFGALDTLRTLPLVHSSVSSPQEDATSAKTTRRLSLKLLDASGASSFANSPFGNTRASSLSQSLTGNTPNKSVLVGSAKRKSRYSSLHGTPSLNSVLDASVTSYGSVKSPESSKKGSNTSLSQSGLSPLSESQEGTPNSSYRSFGSPHSGDRTFSSRRSFTRSVGSPSFESSSYNSDSFSESFHNSGCKSVNSTKFDFDSRQTPNIPQDVFVSPISDTSCCDSPQKTPSRVSSQRKSTKDDSRLEVSRTPKSSRMSSKSDTVKLTKTPGSARTAVDSETVSNILPSVSRRSSLLSSAVLDDTNFLETTFDIGEASGEIRKTRSSQNQISLEESESSSNRRTRKSSNMSTSVMNVRLRESIGANGTRSNSRISVGLVSPSPRKSILGVQQGVKKMKMSLVPTTPKSSVSSKVSSSPQPQKSSPSSVKRSSLAVSESLIARTPRSSRAGKTLTPAGSDEETHETSIRSTRSVSKSPADVTLNKSQKTVFSNINVDNAINLNISSKTPRSSVIGSNSSRTPKSSVKGSSTKTPRSTVKVSTEESLRSRSTSTGVSSDEEDGLSNKTKTQRSSVNTPDNMSRSRITRASAGIGTEIPDKIKTPKSSIRRSVKTPAEKSFRSISISASSQDKSGSPSGTKTSRLFVKLTKFSPEKSNISKSLYSVYSPSNETEVFDLSDTPSFGTPRSSMGSPDKTLDRSVQPRFSSNEMNVSGRRKTPRSSVKLTGSISAQSRQSGSILRTPKSSVKSPARATLNKSVSEPLNTGISDELELSGRTRTARSSVKGLTPKAVRTPRSSAKGLTPKAVQTPRSSVKGLTPKTARTPRSSVKSSVKSIKFLSQRAEANSEEKVEQLSKIKTPRQSVNFIMFSPERSRRSKSLHLDSSVTSADIGNSTKTPRSSVVYFGQLSEDTSTPFRSFLDKSSAQSPDIFPQSRSRTSRNVFYSNVSSVSFSEDNLPEKSPEASKSLSRDMSARLSDYTSRFSVTTPTETKDSVQTPQMESSGKRLSKAGETKTPEGHRSIKSERKSIRVDTPRPRGSLQLINDVSPEILTRTPTSRRVTIGGESHMTPRSRKTPIPLSQKSKSILKTPKSAGLKPLSGIKARKSLRMSMANQLNDILEHSELKTPSPQSNISSILESPGMFHKTSNRKSSARKSAVEIAVSEKSPRRSRSHLDASYTVSTPLPKTPGRSRSFVIDDISRTSLMDISISSPKSVSVKGSNVVTPKTPRTSASQRSKSANKEESISLKSEGYRTASMSVTEIESTPKSPVSRRSVPQGILKMKMTPRALPATPKSIPSTPTIRKSSVKKMVSPKKSVSPKSQKSIASAIVITKASPQKKITEAEKLVRKSLSQVLTKGILSVEKLRRKSFPAANLGRVSKTTRRSLAPSKHAVKSPRNSNLTPKSSVRPLGISNARSKSKTPDTASKSKTPKTPSRKNSVSINLIASGHKTSRKTPVVKSARKSSVGPLIHSADKRKSKTPASARKSVISTKVIKSGLKTPKKVISPKNVLSDFRGVKKLMKTPKPQKSPRNDLSDVRGVKKLLKTPKTQKSPRNDLSDVRGVKKLLKTPKAKKSPRNDLSDVRGVKKLLKTPKPQKSPKNDLSDMKGVKRLLKTPVARKSPKNDLSDLRGVKKLLQTPRAQKSPKNDLSDVRGVKKIMATPKVLKSPKNDLSDVRGLKKLMATPKFQHSPKNDLSNVSGVKQLMRSPRSQKSPKNDLSDVKGVKKLMSTPKVQKSPKNELADVKGVRKLLQTPYARTSPKNDLTNVSGVKKLMKSPKLQKSPVYEGMSSLFLSPKSKSPVGKTAKVDDNQPAKHTKRGQPKTISNASPVQNAVIKPVVDDSITVTQTHRRGRKKDILPQQKTPSPAVTRSGKRKVKPVENDTTEITAKEVKEPVKKGRSKKVESSSEIIRETSVKGSKSTRSNRKAIADKEIPSLSSSPRVMSQKNETSDIESSGAKNFAQQKKVQFAQNIRQQKSITPKGTRSKRKKVEKDSSPSVTSAPRKSLLKIREYEVSEEQNKENLHADMGSRKRTRQEEVPTIQSEAPIKRSRKGGQATQNKVEIVPAAVESKQTTPRKRATRSTKAPIPSSPKSKAASVNKKESPKAATPEKRVATKSKKDASKPATPQKRAASRSRKAAVETEISKVRKESPKSKTPVKSSTPVKVVGSKVKKVSPKAASPKKKAVSRSRKQPPKAVSPKSSPIKESPKAATPKRKPATKAKKSSKVVSPKMSPKKESPKAATPRRRPATRAKKESPKVVKDKATKRVTIEKVVSTKAKKGPKTENKRVSVTPAATRKGRKSVLYEKPSVLSRKSRSPIRSRLRGRK